MNHLHLQIALFDAKRPVMKTIQVSPDDRQQVNLFLDLPFRLYNRIPQWVPPLLAQERQIFKQNKHPFYKHSEAAFFITVQEDGSPTGRIAVIHNRLYNAYHNEKTAFFYMFESEDDPQVAQALFEASFDWAKARGLEAICGPKGFSAFDGMGLLVEGFEHRPALGIPYNPPYYPLLLEAAGFTRANDIVSGYLSGSARLPENIHQVAKLIEKRRGLRVATFTRKSDLRAMIPSLKEVYNTAIEGTAWNYPLTDDEVQSVVSQMLSFADLRLIKLILKGDQIVGFLLAYPDVSAALQRVKGKLFPLGFLNLWLELRRTPWVNINGVGIIKEYRGLGGTALLFSEMEKSIHARGFDHAELVQIGSDNDPMQRELRGLGVNFYKTHRMYQRRL
jgi:hypothetical protein